MVEMRYDELMKELSAEEVRELEEGSKKKIVFDEDSPEMTEEMLREFKRVKQKARNKQTASIRLSEKAQKFSKIYGKGYTSFLSRLIDAALEDTELVKKCL